jgi:Pro-kumamolisin, activation domain
MTGGRSEIAGSVVTRSKAACPVRPADPNQIVQITIVIRRPASLATSAGKTRDEIEQSLSASEADVTAVTDFARRYGLTLKEVSAAKRMVRVQGPAQAMNRAFGIELAYFEGPDGTFLSYAGPLTVESQVAPSIAAVLGLHQEPVAKSHQS